MLRSLVTRETRARVRSTELSNRTRRKLIRHKSFAIYFIRDEWYSRAIDDSDDVAKSMLALGVRQEADVLAFRRKRAARILFPPRGGLDRERRRNSLRSSEAS